MIEKIRAYFADLKAPLLVFTLVSVFLFLLGLAATVMFVAPGPSQQSVKIILPQGASLPRISRSLSDQGMIYHPAVFRVGVRLLGQSRNLQAGEYEIPAHVSAYELMQLLVSGKTFLHAVTIPEGLTSLQVVERLRDIDILDGKLEIIPSEGSLLPETYKVRRGTSRNQMIKLMQNAQLELLAQAWQGRDKTSNLESPFEAIILASIVQKETSSADEFGLVASVFHNRLHQQMKLQSDPTIIYGLVGGRGKLGRPIRRSEIRKKTAYNTYQMSGLPPTPISNPGAAAILAVLNPPSSPYLYFVANGQGGHSFAETLSAHQENVKVWREIQAQTNKD